MLPGPFGNFQDFQEANTNIMQTFDILITIKQCADWNSLPNNHTQVIIILYIRSICTTVDSYTVAAILAVVQVNGSNYFVLQIFVLTKKLYYRVMEAMLLAVS